MLFIYYTLYYRKFKAYTKVERILWLIPICSLPSFKNYELKANLVSSVSVIYSFSPSWFWNNTLLHKYFKYFNVLPLKDWDTFQKIHNHNIIIDLIKNNSVEPSKIQSVKTSACEYNKVACNRTVRSPRTRQMDGYISNAWSHLGASGASRTWKVRTPREGSALREAQHSSSCCFFYSLCQFFNFKSERLRN